MAEMGLGYGSEYQLLRFLGHHRNELNQIIREQTKLKGELIWLDFPRDDKRLSLDGEWKGIEFLSSSELSKVLPAWKQYWAQTGTAQNWDSVIIHKENKQIEYVLVEAKAWLGEIKNEKEGGGKSQNIIQQAFDKTKDRFGIVTPNNWFKPYYQMANRLAFVNFLLSNGIKSSLLNIYFLNGYIKKCAENKNIIVENKSVLTKAKWESVITEEYEYLGINDNAKEYISEIFVKC